MKLKITFIAAACVLLCLFSHSADTTKPPEPKLSHVHIKVSDLKRSIQFYREKLGLRLAMEGDGFAILNVGDGKNLFLDELKGKPIASGGVTLGFSTTTVDQWYEILRSRGVQLPERPENRAWGARSFYFPDPDGHVIEYEQVLRKQVEKSN